MLTDVFKRILVFFLALIALVAAGTLAAGTARAQTIQDCLDCHEDEELTKNDAGKVVSLYVDARKFSDSIHGRDGMTCIDCHLDLDGFEDFPHEEELEEVDCSMCHDDVAEMYAGSLHDQGVSQGVKLAPRCWDCHGAHDITPPSDPTSRVNKFNIPLMCGRCHKEGSGVSDIVEVSQDSILTNYSQSIHGEGLYVRGLTGTAVCSDCHTAHNVRNHTDPQSTIHRNQIARTCQKCHGLIEKVHQKVINGALWEAAPNAVPVCIECHQPHKLRRVYYDEGMSDKDCLACHQKHDLTGTLPGNEGVSMTVDYEEIRGSAHQSVRCIQCHTGATPSHDRPCDTVPAKVDCSICHAEVVEIYKTSIHGKLDDQGDPDAPACLVCHGTHGMLKHSDPDSPTHVRHIPDLCGRCHDEGGVADKRYQGADHSMVANYKQSVHGLALNKSGLVVTATCVDCHTTHAILPHQNVDSSINRSKVSDTCGKCHEGIDQTFRQSIHFTGEKKHGHDLPMCNDCHTSHEIARTDASAFKLKIVKQCGTCHEEVTESYFETYHGKVFALGFTETAACHDCHGQHNVLPPSDPNSTLSRDNIVGTCAQCHEGAHRQFAGYLTHATHHDKDKYPVIHYTWLFMTSLLVGTFVVFGIHTLLWIPRSVQALRHSRQLRKQAKGQKQFRRFNRLQRMIHGMVIVSFLTLAVTGMTLKFSYEPWAQWLAHVLGGFQSAGTLHRMGAILTFFYFARHIVDLHFRRAASGKSWKDFIFDDEGMMLNKRDLQEAGATIKWFVGKGDRPQYGRWTYWEKFDYFAVFWGVAMIGFSGLILWFPEKFTYLLPGWFINVAGIIHSDEALLATGFIFTIHFFNTHFRPDRFPMDPVIFTGRMTLEEFKEDRPREYEQLVREGKLEQHMVEPLDEGFVKVLKFFGFAALTVGMGLIFLIIYAVLFGYR
ncbi:cytochrome c3 family protein [bacterium]|nr:cytochrome c3 family protein [bacterium]